MSKFNHSLFATIIIELLFCYLHLLESKNLALQMFSAYISYLFTAWIFNTEIYTHIYIYILSLSFNYSLKNIIFILLKD